MSDLPFQVERYILKELACETPHADIAEEVRAQFLQELTPKEVQSYDPSTEERVDPDLRWLYEEVRSAYVGVNEDD